MCNCISKNSVQLGTVLLSLQKYSSKDEKGCIPDDACTGISINSPRTAGK